MTDTSTNPTQDLVITHEFDAPVAAVWNAWVDPALVKQWWGPDGFTAPVVELDVREGGTSLVCMSAPDFGENYSIWHYQEILPHERIVYIHDLADANGTAIDPTSVGMPPEFPHHQRHTIVFEALEGDRTRLIVTEHDWTPGQMMQMSEMGMKQCLLKMARAIEGATR